MVCNSLWKINTRVKIKCFEIALRYPKGCVPYNTFRPYIQLFHLSKGTTFGQIELCYSLNIVCWINISVTFFCAARICCERYLLLANCGITCYLIQLLYKNHSWTYAFLYLCLLFSKVDALILDFWTVCLSESHVAQCMLVFNSLKYFMAFSGSLRNLCSS